MPTTLHESALDGSDRLETVASGEPVKSRMLLPILLPLLSIAVVAFLVLNISRVFLAGGADAAVVLAAVITVGILGGAIALAAAERLRTTSLTMISAVAIVVLTGGGLVTLGPSLTDKDGGASTSLVDPPGKPVDTVTVTAGPSTSFDGVRDTGNYTTRAGTVAIVYQGDVGHTLVIADPRYSEFRLGTDQAARHRQKVTLRPGTSTIYCDVLGHEGLGMKATLTVTDG
jgi:hypothetical protein